MIVLLDNILFEAVTCQRPTEAELVVGLSWVKTNRVPLLEILILVRSQLVSSLALIFRLSATLRIESYLMEYTYSIFPPEVFWVELLSCLIYSQLYYTRAK